MIFNNRGNQRWQYPRRLKKIVLRAVILLMFAVLINIMSRNPDYRALQPHLAGLVPLYTRNMGQLVVI